MCDGYDYLGDDRAADDREQAYPTCDEGEAPRNRDDLRPARALVWLTLASALGWAFALALLVYLPRAAAGIPAAAEAQNGPQVLIIQHAPDGPIEQAGTVVEFRYLGATMLVEWVDTTTDPIFRSGFEAAP